MMFVHPAPDGPAEVLVTANEAYPRLEHLFLKARKRICMGFRLFDPLARLQSDAARAVGTTWDDLILHTLKRGVSIDLTVSDFDPVMSHAMHVQSWRFVRRCVALGELAGPGAGRMNARCLRHPAEGGIVPRLMFAFRTRQSLHAAVEKMNESPDPARALYHAPGLHELVKCSNGRVHTVPFALPRVFPGTLHHKLAVFDDTITYIGGLDLNNRRIDDPAHDLPARETWHDVQLVLHDPGIAQDAAAFLDTMTQVINAEQPPARLRSPFVRTQSCRRRNNTFALAPQNVANEILLAHLEQIEEAQTLIYLETQYFRDRRIAGSLARAARRAPGLRVLLMLPAAPQDVAFRQSPGLDARFGEHLQARAIRKVRRAFGQRFFALSPAQPRRPRPADKAENRAILQGAPIVYVHSKVSMFDERVAIVSSANLNGRSLSWDSEAGVVLRDRASVSDLRAKVFHHWLGAGAGPEFHAPETAFDAWRARALENAARAPERRIGFVLPHAVKPARKLGQPLPGAPEEMV